MSEDNERRPRLPAAHPRRFDVGLCPVVVAQVRYGRLYDVSVVFEDPVAFVGDENTGSVLGREQLREASLANEVTVAYKTDPENEDDLGFDLQNFYAWEAARVAKRIMDDPLFQSAMRRALKESLARCS